VAVSGILLSKHQRRPLFDLPDRSPVDRSSCCPSLQPLAKSMPSTLASAGGLPEDRQRYRVDGAFHFIEHCIRSLVHHLSHTPEASGVCGL
jgi:hypothetical protein